MAKEPKYLTEDSAAEAKIRRIQKIDSKVTSVLNKLDQAQTTVKEIINNADDVQDKIIELGPLLGELEALKISTDQIVNEINANKNLVDETKTSVDEKHEEIIKTGVAQEELLEKLIKLEREYASSLKKANEFRADSSETLKLFTDKSMSYDFSTRANSRKIARRWWSAAVAIAFAISAYVVINTINEISKNISSQSASNEWILKVAITTPVVYGLFFVIRQYSHERDLEEKYSFKAMTSQTLQSHAKFLRSEFLDKTKNTDEVEQQILDFTLDNLYKVYEDPLTEKPVARSRRRLKRKTKDGAIPDVSRENVNELDLTSS